MEHQCQWIPINTGTTLAVEIISSTKHCSSSQTLVFVHGLAAQRSVWRESATILSTLGHTCVLVDLRGHGDSSSSSSMSSQRNVNHEVTQPISSFIMATGMGHERDIKKHFSLVQLADDLAALMKALSLSLPAVWIGHSYGGNVCVEVAARHAGMLSRHQCRFLSLPFLPSTPSSFVYSLSLDIILPSIDIVRSLVLVDGGFIDLPRTFDTYEVTF